MNCPVCTQSPLEPKGVLFRCMRCDGAWVQSEVLLPLLERSAATLLELDWKPTREDHVRPCPACLSMMQTVVLGDVVLDRCEPHGVWFDANELPRLLAESKHFRAEDPHDHPGLLRRLGKLIHG